MTEQKKVYVACYGSLRIGMQNEPVNYSAGAVHVGQGITCKNFDLFRYRGAYFPSVSLAHSDNQKPVVVDVFETDMDGLTGPYDRLEGFPDFYNRTEIDVCMDDGRKITAWIYHINDKQEELVASGDWVKYNTVEGV